METVDRYRIDLACSLIHCARSAITRDARPAALANLKNASDTLAETGLDGSLPGRKFQTKGWERTAAALAAMPRLVREWVAELQTVADPAGDLRERRIAEDRVAEVEAILAKAVDWHDDWIKTDTQCPACGGHVDRLVSPAIVHHESHCWVPLANQEGTAG